MPAPREWMDIRTAPKDGSWFIAGKFGGSQNLLYVRDCQWMTAEQFEQEHHDWFDDDADGGVVDNEGHQRLATHWMPLPAPPQ
jgi:hypothetical protein